MILKYNAPRIVCSWPGEGTGETLYQDDRGTTYRKITEAEAQLIRSGTAGRVYQIDCNGNVRSKP